MSIKGIALLGSTGSIGRNALKVIQDHPDRFQVVALAAGSNWQKVVEQARLFRPELVALRDPQAARLAQTELSRDGIRVVAGEEGVVEVASHPLAATVVSAIVGAAGLSPTLAAVRLGRSVALANKECLVMAGSLFMEEVTRHQARLIPVDSEHSAIFQVIGAGQGVESLILTASGGPFRGWDRQRLAKVTPEQALNHPRWEMGQKITIDSATLMNKGLEVIEAHWLFAIPEQRIQVVVHPESLVHSLVAYVDGSVLAQLGMPDMRTPLAVALGWPERIFAQVERLDLVRLGSLTFLEPDTANFPCLRLAREALIAGGSAPAVLNAANEVAVAAFLAGEIPFLEIPALLEWVLGKIQPVPPNSMEDLLAVDDMSRRVAREWVARRPDGKGDAG